MTLKCQIPRLIQCHFFSRPGKSQGLLCKHRCKLLSGSVMVFQLFWHALQQIGLSWRPDLLTKHYLKKGNSKCRIKNSIIGSKVTAILSGGSQMSWFCQVVELHRGGSATKVATVSTFSKSRSWESFELLLLHVWAVILNSFGLYSNFLSRDKTPVLCRYRVVQKRRVYGEIYSPLGFI